MKKTIFKVAKNQPFKFSGYTYVGRHTDYEDVHFYIREVGKDNYELMEAKICIKNKKQYLAAGTAIKTLDSFMYNTLKAELEKATFEERGDFVKYVYENSFKNDLSIKKDEFVNMYTSKVPHEIKTMDIYKEYTKNGYELLYCNRSVNERKFETFSVVLVKKETYDFFGVERTYTNFKPLLYMTKPSYVNKSGGIRFNEFPHSDINILHDILNTK